MIVAVSISLLQPVNCEVKSSYVIPTFKAGWFKAVEHCNSIGMRLAVLDRKSFETELKKALIASHVYKNGDAIVWVGANDLTDEGKFHWTATGKPVEYTNWAKNVPDNSNGEHCMEFGHISYKTIVLDWQWNDKTCSTEQYFACQSIVF